VAPVHPAAPATDPGLKINWNGDGKLAQPGLASANIVVFHHAGHQLDVVFFRRAVFLEPGFRPGDVMHGNEQVASLLLVYFPSASPPARCCAGAEQTACGDRPGAARRAIECDVFAVTLLAHPRAACRRPT
jgi:hypothetical protein